jgi:hypothetical protein
VRQQKLIFDDPILRQRHGEVYQALHWLNPRMVDVVEWFDRFDDVSRQGRSRIETTLNEKLGTT